MLHGHGLNIQNEVVKKNLLKKKKKKLSRKKDVVIFSLANYSDHSQLN